MWFILKDGKNQEGPFEDDIFVQMIHQNKISSSDCVWRDGMEKWYPFGDGNWLRNVVPQNSAITENNNEIEPEILDSDSAMTEKSKWYDDELILNCTNLSMTSTKKIQKDNDGLYFIDGQLPSSRVEITFDPAIKLDNDSHRCKKLHIKSCIVSLSLNKIQHLPFFLVFERCVFKEGVFLKEMDVPGGMKFFSCLFEKKWQALDCQIGGDLDFSGSRFIERLVLEKCDLNGNLLMGKSDNVSAPITNFFLLFPELLRDIFNTLFKFANQEDEHKTKELEQRINNANRIVGFDIVPVNDGLNSLQYNNIIRRFPNPPAHDSELIQIDRMPSVKEAEKFLETQINKWMTNYTNHLSSSCDIKEKYHLNAFVRDAISWDVVPFSRNLLTKITCYDYDTNNTIFTDFLKMLAGIYEYEIETCSLPEILWHHHVMSQIEYSVDPDDPKLIRFDFVTNAQIHGDFGWWKTSIWKDFFVNKIWKSGSNLNKFNQAWTSILTGIQQELQKFSLLSTSPLISLWHTFLFRHNMEGGIGCVSLIDRLIHLLNKIKIDKDDSIEVSTSVENCDYNFFVLLRRHFLKNLCSNLSIPNTKETLEEEIKKLISHLNDVKGKLETKFPCVQGMISSQMTKKAKEKAKKFFDSNTTNYDHFRNSDFLFELMKMAIYYDPNQYSIALGGISVSDLTVSGYVKLDDLLCGQQIRFSHTRIEGTFSDQDSSFSMQRTRLCIPRKKTDEKSLFVTFSRFAGNVIFDQSWMQGNILFHNSALQGDLTFQAKGTVKEGRYHLQNEAWLEGDFQFYNTNIEGCFLIQGLNLRWLLVKNIKVSSEVDARNTTLRGGIYGPYFKCGGKLQLLNSSIGLQEEDKISVYQAVVENIFDKNGQQNWRKININDVTEKVLGGGICFDSATLVETVDLSNLKCPIGVVSFYGTQILADIVLRNAIVANLSFTRSEFQNDFFAPSMEIGRCSFYQARFTRNVNLEKTTYNKKFDILQIGSQSKQNLDDWYIFNCQFARFGGTLRLNEVAATSQEDEPSVCLDDATWLDTLFARDAKLGKLSMQRVHAQGDTILDDTKVKSFDCTEAQYQATLSLCEATLDMWLGLRTRFQHVRCFGIQVNKLFSLSESVFDGNFSLRSPEASSRESVLQNVDLSSSTFNHDLIFDSKCTLHGHSNVYENTLRQDILPKKEENTTGFYEIRVVGSFDARGAKIHSLCFDRANFQGDVSFEGTTFYGSQSFQYAVFQQRLLARKTNFLKNQTLEQNSLIDFSNCTFHGDVSFDNTTCKLPLSFQNSTCPRIFSMRNFTDEASEIPQAKNIKQYVDATSVNFASVQFDVLDLQNTRLQVPFFHEARIIKPQIDEQTLHYWNQRLIDMHRFGSKKLDPSELSDDVLFRLGFSKNHPSVPWHESLHSHRDFIIKSWDHLRKYEDADKWKQRGAKSWFSYFLYSPGHCAGGFVVIMLLAFMVNLILCWNQSGDPSFWSKISEAANYAATSVITANPLDLTRYKGNLSEEVRYFNYLFSLLSIFFVNMFLIACGQRYIRG